jgi:hypothetical protein
LAIALPLPPGAAAVREDQDVGVRRGDEEVTDEVLFPGAHADAPLAAAALHPVGRDRRALDVAGAADGDRHVLVGNQVFDPELAALVDDLGPPRVAEALPHGVQLVDHHLHQQLVAAEDGAQAFDRLHQLGELVDDLLPLEAGQPLQLHVEDGLRLDLRQPELGHQAFARFRRVA